jgi:hypothetical protein
MTPWAFRLTNLVLHGSVLCLIFIVARMVLGTGSGAGFATLAFALTPKAHAIAVLWMSARAEILMAFFSLAATAAWIVWSRNGGARFLALSIVSYAAAVLSKETAIPLPLLFLVTPDARRSWSKRAAAVFGMFAVAVLLVLIRVPVGALMPVSSDTHYSLATPLLRWMRNLRNYSMRMLPAPAALTVVVGLAALLQRGSKLALDGFRDRRFLSIVLFSAGWTLTFLAAVLPIAARSELYLYLPVFGLCLIAGYAADHWHRQAGRRVLVPALLAYVLVLGGYQLSRAVGTHRTLVFSGALTAALAGDSRLQGTKGLLVLAPANSETERLLRDSIGGYLDLIVKQLVGRGELGARVQYSDAPPIPATIRLTCLHQNRRVILLPQ